MEEQEQKSSADGLRELREKKYYDYRKVKDLTVTYKGKKVKFRVILKDMAQKLSQYNKIGYEANRTLLLNQFAEGGFVPMTEYYTQELTSSIKASLDSGAL